jgi:hypothetical protein
MRGPALWMALLWNAAQVWRRTGWAGTKQVQRIAAKEKGPVRALIEGAISVLVLVARPTELGRGAGGGGCRCDCRGSEGRRRGEH